MIIVGSVSMQKTQEIKNLEVSIENTCHESV